MSSQIAQPQLTVYTKPFCVQCTATYRALDKAGLSYQVIDITEDEVALNLVTALGHQQAPVVIDGDQSWSGFRPDLIQAAAQRARVA
ncbi:glutaredoxin-like protein NrdH [Ornithinimicrobium sp. Y1847]|uniref:glutaredoxin-like protein NrdH n=1 Tax=unclassified Ornithinimicrobium TaxID=2615080 RepID=UPI003B6843DB